MSRIVPDLPPIIINRSIARHVEGADTGGSTYGRPVRYFLNGSDTGRLGNSEVDIFWGSRNPLYAVLAARYATQASTILPGGITEYGETTNAAWSELYQTEHYQEIMIQSANNFDIWLEGWLCECRKDQPHSTNTANQSEFWNPMHLLRRGFQENNVDWSDFQTGAGSNYGTANDGMKDPCLTPFNSKAFCQAYKILDHFKNTIKPGETRTVRMADRRKHRIKLTQLQTETSAGDAYDVDEANTQTGLTYVHLRGERFWLFRIQAKQTGENKTTTEIAQISPQVHCLTEIKYVYHLAAAPRVPVYLRLSDVGYNAPGSGTTAVEIVNNAVNAVQDADEL